MPCFGCCLRVGSTCPGCCCEQLSSALPLPSYPAAPPVPCATQIGVSVEPLAELGQKEGAKLGAKEEFAKCVGLVSR